MENLCGFYAESASHKFVPAMSLSCLFLEAGGRLALCAGNGFPSDLTYDYFGRSGCIAEQRCTAWAALIAAPGSGSWKTQTEPV